MEQNWLSQSTTGVSEERSPLRQTMDANAPAYMHRRWLKSRSTRWDYAMTRHTLLEELQPRPHERILEIGCGPGTWTREVVPLCKEMVAVELSEGMVGLAKQYTTPHHVQFIHEDFLKSRPEGKFDKIFSLRAIEYMGDHRLPAAKIADLLAPGGTIVLVTKTRFSLWRGRMRLLHRWEHSKNPGDPSRSVPQTLLSPGQIAAAYKPYGITVERVRPVITRLPIFQNGFYEIPIIPNAIASPFLFLATGTYKVASHMPKFLAPVPLAISESFCITLRAQTLGQQSNS
ncbi:MAG: class I SAM-dependent methyltransferase [Chloroflexi bacterium]|nr:class I SAM-dependent methyltransferase [Chloroflexota bacterium]